MELIAGMVKVAGLLGWLALSGLTQYPCESGN
jgi:hypothetical protein